MMEQAKYAAQLQEERIQAMRNMDIARINEIEEKLAKLPAEAKRLAHEAKASRK